MRRRGRRIAAAGIVLALAISVATAYVFRHGVLAQYRLWRLRSAFHDAALGSLSLPQLNSVVQGDSQVPAVNAVVQAVKMEEKLAVLSVGRDQEVREGFTFIVHRGDRLVGIVDVIKVYEDLCGARILFTADGDRERVQVGDKATTRL